jgi:hypothetical protein
MPVTFKKLRNIDLEFVFFEMGSPAAQPLHQMIHTTSFYFIYLIIAGQKVLQQSYKPEPPKTTLN